MAESESLTRLSDYYKRHGFSETVRRAGLAVTRAFYSKRMLVFYCDLTKLAASPPNLPSSFKLERLRDYSELEKQDLEDLTSFWSPKQAHRNIRERFENQASLWLIKSEDRVAGYSWTIQGRTIAPYYFPLAGNDVQFFDWYVFPKFRGRAVHWFLITHILHRLAAEGVSRAFGDAAAWNQASLSSYKMTPFRPLGWARLFRLFGHTIVSWVESEPVAQAQKSPEKRPGALASARTHETRVG